LSGWHFERNTLAAQRDLITEANWKVSLDTFCEGYHFPVLHSADFGYKVDYCAHHWRYGPEGRNWAVAWPSESLEALRHKPESEWGVVNEHFSIIHYLYPNTIIGLYPETCAVWNIYPGKDVHSQVTRMRMYSRLPNASAEEMAVISQRLELFYKVLQQEDYWISGGIYANLRTGLLPQLLIGRNEPGPGWVHQALNRGLAAL
jgi:phenylpropionate dioxygenase-like ring-hydroxylating dioxygenase large terminal subunit